MTDLPTPRNIEFVIDIIELMKDRIHVWLEHCENDVADNVLYTSHLETTNEHLWNAANELRDAIGEERKDG